MCSLMCTCFFEGGGDGEEGEEANTLSADCWGKDRTAVWTRGSAWHPSARYSSSVSKGAPCTTQLYLRPFPREREREGGGRGGGAWGETGGGGGGRGVQKIERILVFS